MNNLPKTHVITSTIDLSDFIPESSIYRESISSKFDSGKGYRIKSLSEGDESFMALPFITITEIDEDIDSYQNAHNGNEPPTHGFDSFGLKRTGKIYLIEM